MAETVVDTSVLIDYLEGIEPPALVAAIDADDLILPPLAVAELVTGAHELEKRHAIFELLQASALHETPLEHWIAVGGLRRAMATRGLNLTIPDAHVAQCALDRDAILLARDEVFAKIAAYTPLRLHR